MTLRMRISRLRMLINGGKIEKVPGPVIMISCGLVVAMPVFVIDAYLVHRFPKYFPHYLDFTFTFLMVYFAIGLLWGENTIFLKRTKARTISRFFTWALVLSLGALPWYISRSSVVPECVQNLWEIQTAKVEWMTANHKKEYDTPTWEDLKPYLQKRGGKGGMPVCPDGGKYTLGKVGQRPTCSIGDSDHWLPSLAEAPQARVRY